MHRRRLIIVLASLVHRHRDEVPEELPFERERPLDDTRALVSELDGRDYPFVVRQAGKTGGAQLCVVVDLLSGGDFIGVVGSLVLRSLARGCVVTPRLPRRLLLFLDPLPLGL